MKKLVPDPPPVLCVGPGLYHAEAIARAAEHLNKAIHGAGALPDRPTPRNEAELSNILLEMRIAKALLGVALSASPVTVEVQNKPVGPDIQARHRASCHCGAVCLELLAVPAAGCGEGGQESWTSASCIRPRFLQNC